MPFNCLEFVLVYRTVLNIIYITYVEAVITLNDQSLDLITNEENSTFGFRNMLSLVLYSIHLIIHMYEIFIVYSFIAALDDSAFLCRTSKCCPRAASGTGGVH